ncbi:MAG: ABC transporter ATP-binding protein [Actinobacteria bacterium]|nr:ABC transporter ATP-binding protein [Actinomycetota bacterium]
MSAVATEEAKGGAPRDDLVLSVRDLRTEFSSREGPVQAVRGVSFDLRRGEKLAVVGESGCGKSALALSILGLIEPPGRVVGGEVRLNGRVISGLSDRELQAIRGKEMSLVYQDPLTALDPVKTIGSQIAEVVRKHAPVSRKQARARAVQLLEEVEVPNAARRLDDYPHQYSGGMRQRVMIAIALANDPQLLIADEPTTALDVTTQAQVLDLLERLVERHGASVILITHNLGIVAEFCDAVRVMYAGRFVERAGVHDAFARPVHPYTEALLASVPRPERLQYGPLPSIPGLPPNLARIPAGCTFEARCPVGRGREVCRTVEPPDARVEGAAGPVVAACHFADERRSGTAPA